MAIECVAETMRSAGASEFSGGIQPAVSRERAEERAESRPAENEVDSVSILAPYRIYFQVVQIIIAVALTIAILLQVRGAGLGSVFGGTGTVFKTRRGIDKLLFRTTIVLSVLFGALSLFVAAIPAGS